MQDVKDIATGLARIGAVMRAGRWRQAEELGISPIQADLLSFILARGPMTQTALAAELCVTQPTVSDAVAALRRKGLVEARPDPADGRARLLHLMPAGRVAAAEAAGMPADVMEAIAALPEDERAGLLGGLVGLIRQLQAAGGIAPQRMCVSCAHFRPNAYPGEARPHHCAFVNAAFGGAQLRVDCGEFSEAGPAPMR